MAFVGVGTVLAAMQVELAVQTSPDISNAWKIFAHLCQWFSVFVLIFLRRCPLSSLEYCCFFLSMIYGLRGQCYSVRNPAKVLLGNLNPGLSNYM